MAIYQTVSGPIMRSDVLQKMLCEFQYSAQMLHVDEHDTRQYKQRVINLLPTIKQLAAEGNAKAMYMMALLLPKHSSSHLVHLKDAARLGSLDAAYKIIDEHREQVDSKTVFDCLAQLLAGDDLFLKDEAKAFLSSHPEQQQKVAVKETYKQAVGMLFFKPSSLNNHNNHVKNQQCTATTYSR